MELASNQDKSAFATEPVGRLIVKFAIPCVISLVVNALYNIVDQIFIGWGVGYLGNGATNVVFPITIIALALAVLIGDGGAAYLSLKLGEGDLDSVKKGVGNAAVMITIAGIAMLVINTVFDPIFIFIFDMGVRGAAIATILGQIISFLVSIFYLPRFKTFHFDRSALRLHKRVCLSVLSLGVSSFITQIAITIVMALFNNLLAVYGAASVYGSEIIAIIAFFIFQFAPMSVVSIFGSEEGLYNEFAVKCFRIFLMLCPLNGFQTVAAIYLQTIGKPIKSAVVTLSRQIVFLVPVALLLPKAMGVVGVLWAGSAADALAFILALAMIVYEMKKLKKMAA